MGMNPARSSKREVIAFGSLLGVPLLVALVMMLGGPAPAGPATANAAVAIDAGKPIRVLADAAKAAARAEARELRAERRARAAAREQKPLGQVENAAGEPLDVTDACEENVRIAAKQGLTLPDGWAIHCVGPGLDWEGGSHWGVTCPYTDCPEGAGPYVSISNPTYYVVAHELCHANFGNDELMADSCAAEHGATLETSPYQ